LILGSPNAGKTTIADPLIRFIAPHKDRVVCVGPVPKLSVLLGVAQHNVSTVDKDAQEAFFRRQLEEAQRLYPDGERVLAIDEADMYFSSSGRTYGSKALQEIVNIGRNFYVSQVFIARGTSDIAKNCVAAANLVLIGNTTEPNLHDYAKRFMPAVPTDALRDFPPHKFIAYAPNQVPHVLGVWYVEGGEIVCQDWIPPEEEEANGDEDSEEEAPAPTEDIDEAPSPGESASTPDAERPSPTGSASPIAKSTE
jgi:hypothetical protein